MPWPYTHPVPNVIVKYLGLNITATHKSDPYNITSLGCDLTPLLCVVPARLDWTHYSSNPHPDPHGLQRKNQEALSTVLTTVQVTMAVHLLYSPWARPTSILLPLSAWFVLFPVSCPAHVHRAPMVMNHIAQLRGRS